jgi:hypothetical protein
MMFKEKKVITVFVLLSVNDAQIIEIHTMRDSQKISLHDMQLCN